MKRILMAVSALLMIVACEKDNKNTMIVEGNIEGLKMYFEKYKVLVKDEFKKT